MKSERDRVAVSEKRVRAVDLRRAGKSYREIASEMGISLGRAHALVTEALEEVTTEAVDSLRLVEGERLDAALAAIWPRVEGGDLKAIEAFLRISVRRAQLFGIDQTADVAQVNNVAIIVDINAEAQAAYVAEMERAMKTIPALMQLSERRERYEYE